MGYNDASQPGGWFGVLNIKAHRKFYLSTAALAAGSFLVWGAIQGREAVHYAELTIDQCTSTGCQTAQWQWEGTGTGFIMADDLSYVIWEAIAAPASRLILGVGDSGSTGSTINTKIAELTPAVGNVQTLKGSGSVALPNKVKIGPDKYITASWYNGSGASANGLARIKVEPCTPMTCD